MSKNILQWQVEEKAEKQKMQTAGVISWPSNSDVIPPATAETNHIKYYTTSLSLSTVFSLYSNSKVINQSAVLNQLILLMPFLFILLLVS